MKKLALAPVVALAITGLAASPVIAAPSGGDAFARTGVQAPSDGGQPADSGADAQKLAAQVSVSPQEISQTDLNNEDKGVVVTVTGLEAGDKVSDSLTGDAGEAKGDTMSYNIFSAAKDASKIPTGTVDFTVTVKRGEETQDIAASFTVVEDETEEPTAPVVDPKVTLATDTISVAEISTDGLKFSGEGFTPGGTVTISGGQLPNQAKAQSGTQADEPLKADENGKITGTLVAPESVKPGKYAVVFTDDETGEATDPHQFTVTEDATDDPTEDPTTPVAEAKLIVSPESVTPQDFVNEKKGVKLAVENCEPGEDVRFLVNPEGNTNVTAFDRTVKADDEGKADVTVYGTSKSNPNAYTGDYSVTVTCGDDKLTGKFSVEADPNAGGGAGGNDDGGNGNGTGGGDLPRTGMELGGLAAGAALLLVGGAVVTMTKRRRSAALSPSDI
ncbi:Uncharacterised protein [Mycobacteroides abscessus subsp. abscessus]|uniref:Gram-positive cocci surface proteins LPxTG domain-containing protein n=1 Tax=Brevibacterium casei TaxID=33889 RepID=A0A162Y2V5_9MICO|nr:hypothetical protein [Brevibacterium casei]NJE65705.1 hypothetical protein [Brevibacterium sp. LS14]SIJ75856.1 Uncharacterised protein [Mycobacteroides abscessus subsp. abscessus]KZE11373.1 hypothetical protein AVW13_16590 [Brevibacterium casei]MBE4696165.1 hypothetical protein [Brevibacterium casei]MBY3579287.1 hypothetical protein [Brevibacterium casei]